MAAAVDDHAVPYDTAKADMVAVKTGEDGATIARAGTSTTSDPPYDPEFPDDEYPTEEELCTLERQPDSIPYQAYLIGVVELCERLSFYGCSATYVNFIQQPLPEGSTTGALVRPDQSVPGALGFEQRASTGLTTFNNFWNYVTPLIGGWVADAHLGRFTTIMYGIVAAILGHVLLIVAALPPVIANPNGSLGCFAVAIVVIGCGTGAFKPNISPLIAEQYKRKHVIVRTTKHGTRYLVDPTMTHARIFVWFYFLINCGSIIGQVTMVYAERHVGFWLAYTLPTIVFGLSPLILWVARKRYNRTPPQGSVLGKCFRVVRLALKGTWSWNPVKTFRAWSSPEIWDKAKPTKMARVPDYVTWDDAWPDQVRRGLSACVVFVPFPVFWLCYNQITNNLLSQAATMDLNGVPNDLLQNLNPLSIIIMIPIFDFIIYPIFRKIGLRHTPIRKMTWGFFCGALAMMSSAILQHYIYNSNPCGFYVNDCEVKSSINVWAQSPSYILIGLSEIFASITGLEYAFTKAPTNMRSLVTSLWLFMTAISSAIGQALVALSEDPLLIWNYGFVAVLAALAGTGFWFWFRGLDRQEEEMNALKEGKVLSAKELATQHVQPQTPEAQEPANVDSEKQSGK